MLASFRDAVAMFDRRFDSRTMRLIEGPTIHDGVVHIKTVNTYRRDGVAPLELVGEETAFGAARGDASLHHDSRPCAVYRRRAKAAA